MLELGTGPVILAGAGLIAVSILTSLLAYRFGAPLLLLFLAVGMLAGPHGLALVDFADHQAALLIGTVALAIVLFESGIATRWRSFRLASGPALTLATLGTLLTAGAVAVAAHAILNLEWTLALLLGGIVASTDAAAVFFLLRTGGITLRERVRATLEIESGSNDPLAILLTISIVELYLRGGPLEPLTLLIDLGWALGLGAALGLAGGWGIRWLLNRLRLDEQLYPLLALALALLLFAVTEKLGASAFLAIYVCGLLLGNLRVRSGAALRRFHDGLSWLAQIIMFVTLGLLADPLQFESYALPAGTLALFLILIARPLAVAICLLPFRFTLSEIIFIGLMGLRGAVSILLALLPIIAGLPAASTIFPVVFMIVILSLSLQGWLIKPLAQKLRLIVPPQVGPVQRTEIELPMDTNFELVSYIVHPDSPATGGDIPLPAWVRPALLIRDGRPVGWQSGDALQPHDHLYLFTHDRRIPLLDRLFGQPVQIEPAVETAFFGDLTLKASARLADLAREYAVPQLRGRADLTLAELFANEFGDHIELGDRLRLGNLELVARDVDEAGGLSRVGLVLVPSPLSGALRIDGWQDWWRSLWKGAIRGRDRSP